MSSKKERIVVDHKKKIIYHLCDDIPPQQIHGGLLNFERAIQKTSQQIHPTQPHPQSTSVANYRRKVTKDKYGREHTQLILGGNASETISNLGTSALQGVQENVLYKLPEIGKYLKFVGDNVVQGVDTLFGIHPKTLQSALHYQETGQRGYETDQIANGVGSTDNLGQNFDQAFNLEVNTNQSPTQYSYAKYQQQLKDLKQRYLEPRLGNLVYWTPPKRHSQDVLDKINFYVSKQWMSPHNVELYYDWDALPDDKPRNIPDSPYFEIGDNPPKLVPAPSSQVEGGKIKRSRAQKTKKN